MTAAQGLAAEAAAGTVTRRFATAGATACWQRRQRPTRAPDMAGRRNEHAGRPHPAAPVAQRRAGTLAVEAENERAHGRRRIHLVRQRGRGGLRGLRAHGRGSSRRARDGRRGAWAHVCRPAGPCEVSAGLRVANSRSRGQRWPRAARRRGRGTAARGPAGRSHGRHHRGRGPSCQAPPTSAGADRRRCPHLRRHAPVPARRQAMRACAARAAGSRPRAAARPARPPPRR